MKPAPYEYEREKHLEAATEAVRASRETGELTPSDRVLKALQDLAAGSQSQSYVCDKSADKVHRLAAEGSIPLSVVTATLEDTSFRPKLTKGPRVKIQEALRKAWDRAHQEYAPKSVGTYLERLGEDPSYPRKPYRAEIALRWARKGWEACLTAVLPLVRETWSHHQGPETGCLRGCREQICWDWKVDHTLPQMANPRWMSWNGEPKMIPQYRVYLRKEACDLCKWYFENHLPDEEKGSHAG